MSPANTQEPTTEPLADAFARLVFNNPRIVALGKEVERLDRTLSIRARNFSKAHDRWPLIRTLHLLSGDYGAFSEEGGQYWPVIFDEELRDELDSIRYRKVSRRETVAHQNACVALEAFLEAFTALITPLRIGLIAAQGHTPSGDLVPLSAGVWSSGDLCIDPNTGDLGVPDFATIRIQNAERERRPFWYVPTEMPARPFNPRYESIQLIRDSRGHPSESKSRKPKTPVAVEKATQIIQRLHNEGFILKFAYSKEALREINRQLEQAGQTSVSPSTVKRALSRFARQMS